MALWDRGDEVRKEQERLNSLGANLTVDGIWGPKTQAAFEQYGADTGTGNTAQTGNGSDLLLAGEPQIWKNETTGLSYVVYVVPAVTLADGTTSGEISYGWLLETNEDIEAVVGPGKTPVYHFSGDDAAFTEKGLVDLGNVSELRMDDLEGDPFDTWVEDLLIVAKVMPWVLDADYQKMAVQAALERADGSVSLEELKSTKWWTEHTAPERLWMETVNGDPATAEAMLEDNRASMRFRLARAGIDNASEELIEFMADNATMGHWTIDKLDAQIAAVADPSSVDVIDDELYEFLATEGIDLDTTMGKEDVVRGLLQTWLGPNFGDWTDEQIAQKAGELRNNPDGEMEFIEGLKDQRAAMFPNYGDRNSSYQAIMQPWKSVAQSAWGVPVDETDEAFQRVVQMNNPDEAAKLLRSTGFDRGYDKVVNEVASGLKSSVGSNVRGAV